MEAQDTEKRKETKGKRWKEGDQGKDNRLVPVFWPPAVGADRILRTLPLLPYAEETKTPKKPNNRLRNCLRKRKALISALSYFQLSDTCVLFSMTKSQFCGQKTNQLLIFVQNLEKSYVFTALTYLYYW